MCAIVYFRLQIKGEKKVINLSNFKENMILDRQMQRIPHFCTHTLCRDNVNVDLIRFGIGILLWTALCVHMRVNDNKFLIYHAAIDVASLEIR